MDKIKAQYLDLKKALKRLREATKLPSTQIHQDATIQRFEFTFEMSWKLIGSILRENRIDVYGVKNIFREGARLGLISDPNEWFDFLEARNMTVHTYQEKIASDVYKKAKQFVKSVEDLIRKAEKHLG